MVGVRGWWGLGARGGEGLGVVGVSEWVAVKGW